MAGNQDPPPVSWRQMVPTDAPLSTDDRVKIAGVLGGTELPHPLLAVTESATAVSITDANGAVYSDVKRETIQVYRAQRLQQGPSVWPDQR